jgi:hypothetical protein
MCLSSHKKSTRASRKPLSPKKAKTKGDEKETKEGCPLFFFFLLCVVLPLRCHHSRSSKNVGDVLDVVAVPKAARDPDGAALTLVVDGEGDRIISSKNDVAVSGKVCGGSGGNGVDVFGVDIGSVANDPSPNGSKISSLGVVAAVGEVDLAGLAGGWS